LNGKNTELPPIRVSCSDPPTFQVYPALSALLKSRVSMVIGLGQITSLAGPA